MKIAYCISGTHNSGGMERVLSNKANYLASHGYEVTIITTDQRGKEPFFTLDRSIKCVDLDVNYESNNGKSFFNKLIHYPIKQLKHKRRLTEVLNQVKPDITISMFCNDVAFLPSIKDGSKKILEIHFSRFKRLQYNRKGLWRLADRWRNHNEQKQVKRFDKFVVLTREDMGYWEHCANIAYIPNAQTFLCDVPASLDNKTVIAVGRYTYQKGFDMLLKAWSLICNKIDGWELHIIGEGELRDSLLQQVKSLSLENSVKLCPATTDIRRVYQEASVLVLSSRYEGFGMVLLEAQTFGVPTVSFNCKCGPSEIVSDGVTGYLVSANDVTELSKKLLVLMQNEKLRKQMGHNAFIDATRFSEKEIMQQWIDLFESL